MKKREIKVKGITLFELRLSTCRFIVSDNPENVIYCGNVVHKVSYCKNHYKICYYPAKNKLNLKVLV